MKIITLVTTVARGKDGTQVYTPPGEVDLDDDTAKALLARGQAVTLKQAKAEAEAEEAGPKVKQQGGGPKVKGQ